MRLVNLFVAAMLGLAALVRRPPKSKPSGRVTRSARLALEELYPREVPAVVIPLDGLTAVTAIDVLDNGTVQAVGYKTDTVTGLRVGEFVTVSPGGQVSMQQLGSGSLLGPDVVPIAISNGRAVGGVGGFSPSTGRTAGRALGWDLTNPGLAYDLGSVGPNDLTGPSAVNRSGLWVGDSNGVLLAVYGQLFGQTTPSVLPIPPLSAASADDVADDGTKVVSVNPAGLIEARVYRPDDSFVALPNPFALEGSTVMFGWRISEDGTKVLANADRFDPVTETWGEVAVVFSGPNWSQWTAASLPGGASFFGQGMDIEDSGLVTIRRTDGIYLWQPGQSPQRLDTMLGSSSIANTTFGIDYNAANTTYQKGGVTYVVSSSASGVYLIELGTPIVPPPPSDPPPMITGTAGSDTITVDLGQYHTTSVVTVNALAGNDVIRVVGNADHAVRVVVNGGAGNDRVFFTVTGPVTAEVNLGAGNDLFDGRLSAVAFTVHGDAGNDVIYGSGTIGNVLFGDAGNDLLFGGSGDDEIHTGPGVNIAVSGGGRDRIFSGSRLDFIFADRDDELWGNPLFVFGRPRRRF